jgi:cytoskeleton protein RodZ
MHFKPLSIQHLRFVLRLTPILQETYHDRDSFEKKYPARGTFVGTFGERLRREREMRGINLDEISTATKISTRNLRALEEEKFNQLPGGVFNKGFVRAYAKFLGIDEEQIVAEYESAAHETEAAREQKLVADLSKAEVKRPDDQEISLEPKSQWGTIAVIVLVAVVAYAGYNYYQRKKAEHERPVPQHAPTETQSDRSAPSDTPDSPVNASPVPPAEPLTPPESSSTSPTSSTSKNGPDSSTLPSTKEASSAAQTPASINVKLRVLEDSWISVKADGKLLVSGTLSAGMEKTYKGNDRIEVVLGKAGGVELSYNGKPVENISQGQDVRKITFTPSGYE